MSLGLRSDQHQSPPRRSLQISRSFLIRSLPNQNEHSSTMCEVVNMLQVFLRAKKSCCVAKIESWPFVTLA
jgi:hypothetical protein